MAANGWQILETLGDEAREQETGASQAVDYYQKSLQINPDNVGAVFKIGMIYKATGDTDTANQYFGEIIMNHSDSEYAEQARTERGY